MSKVRRFALLLREGRRDLFICAIIVPKIYIYLGQIGCDHQAYTSPTDAQEQDKQL